MSLHSPPGVRSSQLVEALYVTEIRCLVEGRKWGFFVVVGTMDYTGENAGLHSLAPFREIKERIQILLYIQAILSHYSTRLASFSALHKDADLCVAERMFITQYYLHCNH